MINHPISSPIQEYSSNVQQPSLVIDGHAVALMPDRTIQRHDGRDGSVYFLCFSPCSP